MSSRADITVLLTRMAEGDRAAEAEVLPQIYHELHRLAAFHLSHERPGHTLQPTALVHEAFLRMTSPPAEGWRGRGHFFAVSAQVMRQILTDYARQRNAAKRGGGAKRRVELHDGILVLNDNVALVVELDEALTRLGQFAPRQAKVVEMRFFAGLDVEEIAEHLGITPRTVKRDWKSAKAWLLGELSSPPQKDS